jgi:hypothetical protein
MCQRWDSDRRRATGARIFQRQFNLLLERTGLKHDPVINTHRSVYSLRHTAICMRITTFPDKPKGMHWKTHRRLAERDGTLGDLWTQAPHFDRRLDLLSRRAFRCHIRFSKLEVGSNQVRYSTLGSG